jgi:hypothetical protein
MAGMFIPPGDHYDVIPPRVPEPELEASWVMDREKETIRGTSAKASGVSAVVTPASPKILRESVECIAYYFERELECTVGVPYCSLEKADDQHRAYLWTDGGSLPGEAIVIGACCFRWRQWTDAPAGFDLAGYALQWIWFHPYERRKGHLERAWPYFEGRFGRVIAEGPFSPAMEAFLRKHRAFPFET